MRIFEKPNLSNDWKCPICNKNTETPVCLITIDGTKDGNIAEAEQVHVDCINLTMYKKDKILAQRF